MTTHDPASCAGCNRPMGFTPGFSLARTLAEDGWAKNPDTGRWECKRCKPASA